MCARCHHLLTVTSGRGSTADVALDRIQRGNRWTIHLPASFGADVLLDLHLRRVHGVPVHAHPGDTDIVLSGSTHGLVRARVIVGERHYVFGTVMLERLEGDAVVHERPVMQMVDPRDGIARLHGLREGRYRAWYFDEPTPAHRTRALEDVVIHRDTDTLTLRFPAQE